MKAITISIPLPVIKALIIIFFVVPLVLLTVFGIMCALYMSFKEKYESLASKSKDTEAQSYTTGRPE